MVSKRLAFAVVVVLGIVCAVFIFANIPARSSEKDGENNLPTYKYNSLPLKFHEGNVNILAHDGHLAYTGPVADGMVKGTGTLFDKDGGTVYTGEFDKNLFNGTGQLFYPEGVLEYQGQFADNLFHGIGSYYRFSGTVEYEGEYVLGKRSGLGTLYNGAGTQVFTGSFRNDEIVFSELLDKTTEELSEMYTGSSDIYTYRNEFCVTMGDINAAYSAHDGSNTLDGNWSVGTVYVLSPSVSIGNENFTSIEQLTQLMGAADYFGTAWINLGEAVCINNLVAAGNETVAEVSISTTAELDEVFTVNSYDTGYTVYIYSFVYDGLVYTFYCPEAGANQFLMYSIEVAQ